MDDVAVWSMYPQHRWLFNKLEVALRLEYSAAPIVVPVTEAGKYVIRPIYNLYGMGVGAHVKDLDPGDAFEDHVAGPPGTFWCEYFEGDHVSVDYKWVEDGKGGIHSGWRPVNAMLGEPGYSLQTFRSWTRIEPPLRLLPGFVEVLDDVADLNIEWKGEHVIEVHLRTGNDVIAHRPMGTVIYPIFDEMHVPAGHTFIPNDGVGRYDANGHLPANRLGYYVKNPRPDWG